MLMLRDLEPFNCTRLAWWVDPHRRFFSRLFLQNQWKSPVALAEIENFLDFFHLLKSEVEVSTGSLAKSCVGKRIFYGFNVNEEQSKRSLFDYLIHLASDKRIWRFWSLFYLRFGSFSDARWIMNHLLLSINEWTFHHSFVPLSDVRLSCLFEAIQWSSFMLPILECWSSLLLCSKNGSNLEPQNPKTLKS